MLSAGTAARRLAAREQIDELGPLVDWSLLAELLRARRLLPLLGPRLVELVGDRHGDEFEATMTQGLEAGRRQGVFLQLIAARLMSALGAAGIASADLKGPRLSEALYGDPGRRPSGDIDLLVAPGQLLDAVEVVRTFGYDAPTDHVESDGLPLLHFALIHERGELPPVELHWRIHWYERCFARERLLAPISESPDEWRPAPVDELAALLLFYARDGFINMRLAVDIGAWWDSFGGDVRPGALDELIDAYPAFEHVLPVTVKVAERMVGLPAERLTKRASKLGARGGIALRLADPYPRSSEAQVYADMGLIDGLLAPSGGFRAFINRQVAPSGDVIREHAQRANKTRVSSTAGYSVRVLARYGLAMTRLLWARQAAWSKQASVS